MGPPSPAEMLTSPLWALQSLSARREINPSLYRQPQDLARTIRAMRSKPRELQRPLVVVGGWRSPPLLTDACRRRLVRMVGTGPSLAISRPLAGSIERFADEFVHRVRARFGESAIDVVAISMGGLVSRYSALELGLPIARLFTLGTPHRGARLARWIRVDRAGRSMKPGSDWLAELDGRGSQRDAAFELVPYAHLNDTWVGASNSAPPGMTPLWTAGTHLMSHFTVSSDPLILADIARRLRGERPLAAQSELSPPPCD